MRLTNLLASSLFLAAACAPDWPPNYPKLKTAKSVTIFYSVEAAQRVHPNRQLAVSKPAKLLALLDVESAEKAAVGLAPWGWLEFEMPDGKRHRCTIVKPDLLNVWDGTILNLKTRRFSDEVNALLSAHEGRPIDVLANN